MIIRKADAQIDRGTPAQAAALGQFEALLYSDSGGLTQFGAFVETLEPGARSSDRHWHEEEDEFLYMLSGEATVIEDAGEAAIGPGDACCWPAGVANGHHLENRSDAPCSYLVVGTRKTSDVVHYSTIDKILIRENGARRLVRRDGSPFVEGQ
ncbi:cupin domain-containing protein [Sedimentimonas flavescens]|uniref:cupin domain-containing protein n=1 Tax=Sedimentimonas flavescens TaxID=2851012 RepID=UPI001C49D875|nr:cupin domain-containing protein [Sedimentimonas flavescens]MBW0156741.1 cupin domain-containing protein [Sedimentimonas flavescens]MCT2539234.1 cupin domain-containing protein [Sedimentimonas flavescens]